MILLNFHTSDQTAAVPPLRVLAGGLGEHQPVTLDRFIGWYARRFGLIEALGRVGDGRVLSRVTVPLPTVLLAVVTMFWIGRERICARGSPRVQRRPS